MATVICALDILVFSASRPSRVFQANEPKMERTMEPSHIQRTAMVTQAFGQAVSDYTPQESSKNAHISACEDSKSNWSQAILT